MDERCTFKALGAGMQLQIGRALCKVCFLQVLAVPQRPAPRAQRLAPSAPMKIFDHTFPTPQENLAADEALLEAAENGESGEVLRFWESKEYFVALGYTNSIETEVRASTCRQLGIPILRRVSGGGTVLQGPNCWNYSLILNLETRPELHNVSSANCYIMRQQRNALIPLLGQVEIRGTTDLALNERKFSGNAQRRKRRFTLFHGTILLDFDWNLLSQVLAAPSRQPDYRQSRSHRDFLTSVNVSRDDLRRALSEIWDATGNLDSFPHERMNKLIAERYNCSDWNEKF